MKQKELKYIEQEIKIHSQLDHPNIIKLFKVFRESHYIHLLLEFAPNGSLFDYCRTNRSLSDTQITFIFKSICEGINYLHSFNFLHRDLKPENILFGNDFTPKIADFGFACEIILDKPRRTVCGTREYFSPELYTHKDQCLQLDIWCLGILLYELTHGKTPFDLDKFSFADSANLIKKKQYRYYLIAVVN